MPKPKPSRRRRPAESADEGAETTLCGSTLGWRLLKSQLGSDPEFRRAWDRWNPADLPAAQVLVRDACVDNPCPLVSSVLRLKSAFLLHGLRLCPTESAGDVAGDTEPLADWLRAPLNDTVRTTGSTLVARLAADVAEEWLMQDSAVVSWKESSVRPYLLLSEDIRYSARGGVEKVEWKHGLTGNELDEFIKQHPVADQPKLRQRYEKDYIRLEDPQWNEEMSAYADYAAVATRNRWGGGLRMPTLRGLLTALDQWRNMELGEVSYSYAGRKVFRQYKKGFEPPSSGPNAGTITTRADKGWAKRAKENHGSKLGYYEGATDFDEELALHWLDVKNFDAEKWDTVLNRVAAWAGPLGFLLLGKGTQAGDLWQLFEAEIGAERVRLGALLGEVLGEFAPGPVTVEFADDCFVNPRVRSDLLKQGYASGSVSSHTYLERLNLRLDEELEHKRTEIAAEKKDPGVLKPVYDAAHGDPAAAGGNAGGRPEGTPDP